jgi:hypothetical protein
MLTRLALALVLLAAPALAQEPPKRTPESYVIEDAAREAATQMQQAIMARAKVAELAARIAELEKALAEAQKRAEGPK